MTPALRALVAAALLAAACASDEPSRGGDFDDSAGRAVVALRGDGFCTLDGERMPFDAMLLRLRVRARSFDDATLRRWFSTELWPGPGPHWFVFEPAPRQVPVPAVIAIDALLVGVLWVA